MIEQQSYRFPKKERLKSRLLIHQLFQNGTVMDEWPVRCLYIVTTADSKSDVAVGVTVSKRSFPKATDRNRIKRMMREAWRLNKQIVSPALADTEPIQVCMMFLYTGKNIPDYHDVEGKIRIILSRFIEGVATNRKVDK